MNSTSRSNSDFAQRAVVSQRVGRCEDLVPRVSVILPVYNRASMVAETIQSVLNQTFGDWELLVIDDGSTDRSLEIIRRFLDPRVRVFVNPRNLGLIRTLNRGIEEARGEFLARIDSDDVPLPSWLRKTVDYLESHPKTVLVSTWAQHYENPKVIDRRPTDPRDVEASLFLGNCIKHPGVVMRAALFKNGVFRYRQEYPHAEDYKLWIELLSQGDLVNLAEPLVKIRYHRNRITQRYRVEMVATLLKVQMEMLRILMPSATQRDLETHRAFLRKAWSLDFCDALAWRRRLVDANRESRIYNLEAFERALDRHLDDIHVKRLDRSLFVVLCEKVAKKLRLTLHRL